MVARRATRSAPRRPPRPTRRPTLRSPRQNVHFGRRRVRSSDAGDTELRDTNRLLVASGAYRSYLRFTVSGLTGTVTNVKLRLRVTDPSTNGGRVYTVGGSWTETGITWNNAPAISGTPIATIGAITDNTWKELDLTGIVTVNGTYNLAISDGNSNNAEYASREATAANRPQLVITTAP